MKKDAYFCLACNGDLYNDRDGLRCSEGHIYPFIQGTQVPVFDCEDENVNEYTVTEAAKIHENSLAWLFSTFGGTEDALRKDLISRLHLKEGQTILITGVGAGNDLPVLADQIGKEGAIFAQDYSRQMLQSAVTRAENVYGLVDHAIEFSVSDATNLPFPDNYFDAVYHFGGLNLFPSIGKGISEMDRVTKDGGRVVFGDEGLAPWLKNTEYGRIIINNNSLCDFDVPLAELPTSARNVNLSWAVGYCFYIIDYTSSNSPIPINLDVPHIGRRGGTMRTRYFGQLEGIEPELKKTLYAEAENRGLSRVEFIEILLRDGLED